MSEYWKSTPNYWCKHCSVFVKDTKFEKSNHEASGRHQGALKRFLRQLHQGNEREEREKQRAKAEVDRLNGVARPPPPKPTIRRPAGPAPQITPAERQRQVQQLAAMGISIPEDFRRGMAVAGTWQPSQINEPEPAVPNLAPSIGVRKRQSEEDASEEPAPRKAWGSAIREYPGQSNGDLDVLLAKPIAVKAESTDIPADSELENPVIKQEESTKQEQGVVEPSVQQPASAFKRRKPKAAKER